jgi:hypothetical protein
MAVRPMAGAPSLICKEPVSAKNAATLDAFWLHQAAVYLVAKSLRVAEFMGVLFEVQLVTVSSKSATILERICAFSSHCGATQSRKYPHSAMTSAIAAARASEVD